MYSTDSRDELIGWIDPNRVVGAVSLIEKENSKVHRLIQWMAKRIVHPKVGCECKLET